MKSLCLLLFAFCIGVPAIFGDGEFRNASGNTVGYLKSDGSVRDSAENTVGYFRDDGDVRDRSGNSIG